MQIMDFLFSANQKCQCKMFTLIMRSIIVGDMKEWIGFIPVSRLNYFRKF